VATTEIARVTKPREYKRRVGLAREEGKSSRSSGVVITERGKRGGP